MLLEKDPLSKRILKYVIWGVIVIIAIGLIVFLLTSPPGGGVGR